MLETCKHCDKKITDTWHSIECTDIPFNRSLIRELTICEYLTYDNRRFNVKCAITSGWGVFMDNEDISPSVKDSIILGLDLRIDRNQLHFHDDHNWSMFLFKKLMSKSREIGVIIDDEKFTYFKNNFLSFCETPRLLSREVVIVLDTVEYELEGEV